MKEGIHPEYPEATIDCSCGSSFATRSTRGSFRIEICSACHPFFTGKQKLIDSEGRIERFSRKYGSKQARDEKAAAAATAAAAASAPAEA